MITVDQNVLFAILGAIIIPWGCYVTITLFNHRQEIALLKEIAKSIKEAIQDYLNKPS